MSFSIKRIENGITTGIKDLDQQGLTSWLIAKKLINEKETLYSFNDIKPWNRSGGETYSTIFDFQTDKQKKTIIVKAIVTIFPEISLINWTNRRKILTENRIPVSHWFCTNEATIYEPFYPNKSDKIKDFNLLIQIAFTLDRLGFTTLNFLNDIMCDSEGNPFYIDFGFDLGEPSQNMQISAKDCLIRNYPSREADIKEFYRIILDKI